VEGRGISHYACGSHACLAQVRGLESRSNRSQTGSPAPDEERGDSEIVMADAVSLDEIEFRLSMKGKDAASRYGKVGKAV
jgi:hypothetical protein